MTHHIATPSDRSLRAEMRARRTQLQIERAADAAHALAETIDDPWLYRAVTD